MKYKTTSQMDDNVAIGCFGFMVVMLVCWTRHVIWVISILSAGAATNSQIILGVIGAFVFPVGVIHGIMLFFGFAV